MKPIKMNGIKLSSRYALVYQTIAHASKKDPVHLYQRFSDGKINILFLSASFMDSKRHMVCCVEPADFFSVKSSRPAQEISFQPFEYIPSAGILSVYPHQFQLTSLGYLLYFFGAEDFHFYQLATSPSMISFTVDYADQEKIADTLAAHIELPKTHTPYRQEINMDEFLQYLKKDPETKAPYVEEKIKTYAIHTRNRVILIQCDIFRDTLRDWGTRLQQWGDSGFRFCHAAAFSAGPHWIHFFLVIESGPAHRIKTSKDFFCDMLPKELAAHVHMVSPADMISFHGPHFGDRYGIAGHAMAAMAHGAIPVLLMGCVGSSISLVVPENMGVKGKSALSEFFETP